jgi:hypothetical protein
VPNLHNILTLIVLGAITASVGMFFQMTLRPTMIFNFYAKWLLHRSENNKFWEYVANPLGLCVKCNTTWIAIFVWCLSYEFSWMIILFIGITYMWLELFLKLNIKW